MCRTMNHEVKHSLIPSDRLKLLSPIVSDISCPKVEVSGARSSSSAIGTNCGHGDFEAITAQPALSAFIEKLQTADTQKVSSLNGDLECLDDTLTAEKLAEQHELNCSFVQDNHHGGQTNFAFESEDEMTTPRANKFITPSESKDESVCYVDSKLTDVDQFDGVSKDVSDLNVVIQEHEVIILDKHVNVQSAPGRALRKLDPRKLNLTLDLFSSKNKKKDRTKSSSSSNTSSLSPKTSSPYHSFGNIPVDNPLQNQLAKKLVKTQLLCKKLVEAECSEKTSQESVSKTSWLLRLFESQV